MKKKFFLEAQIKSEDKEEGVFEVVASSKKVDRMGDTIDPRGWYLKNYKKNPVILWSHSTGGFGSAAVPPVAKADKVWIEDEKELKIKGHFADTPFAQELKALVEGGFLNAVSVGFMPLVEDEKGLIEIDEKMYRRSTDEEVEKGIYGKEGEHFSKQELLELSWVNVPALPQALVSARKMNLGLVTKALEQKIEEVSEEKEEKEEKEVNDKDDSKDNKDDKEKDKNKENKEEDEPIEDRILKVEKAISDLKDTIKNPGDATPQQNIKGRKPFIKQKSKKSDMERLLIMFDKMCETLLRKLRQQK